MSWKYEKLEKYYVVHNGLSKGSKYFGSGFPFLSFSTVFNNFFIPNKINDLVQSTENEQKNYSIKKGDVFITRTSETSNELGMSCVALKDYPFATFNGFTKRMRPINENIILPKFIGYYMRTPKFRGEFQAFSTMTTRASLKNEQLLSIKVPIPPIETQEKIADILSNYDDLIENNQKQIKLLEEAAQRLYKKWFVDFQFPGHETTPIINNLPHGWKKEKVGDRIKLLSGFAFSSNDFTVKGKYKIVTIKNVNLGQFDYLNVNHIDDIPQKMPDYCKLKDFDILISLTGNVGRVCLVYGENYLLNQRVAKLKTDYPAFAYCLFRNQYMFLEINNLANGSAQQNLSPIRVENMKINFSNDILIEKFENIVYPMIEKIVNLNKKNILLTEARDRLLPKLMNEEIEV